MFMKRNNIKTIPFTAKNYAEKKAKFKALIARRKELMESLIEARNAGDLSENAGYSCAKFELGNVGRQLRYYRKILEEGYVVNNKSNKGVAEFGSQVTIQNSKKTLTFTLVSEYEADASKSKISLNSPIGSELVGKRAGDQIKVKIPKGISIYTIVEVN